MSATKQQKSGKLNSGNYRREMKRSWFMEVPFYQRYAVREATAITTLIYTIILICGLAALVQGPAEFSAWVEAQKSFLAMAFADLALLMALYHTMTWFAAAPKAMPLQFGVKKVPEKQVILGNWVIMILASIIVFFIIGR